MAKKLIFFEPIHQKEIYFMSKSSLLKVRVEKEGDGSGCEKEENV